MHRLLLRLIASAGAALAVGTALAAPDDSPSLFDALGKLLAPKPEAATTEPPVPEPANRGVLPASERRVALIIGNADYKSGPLGNPVNDARAMADRLGALGFEVIRRENLKVREIGGVYREFRSKIVPGGVALVFYAGHGVQFKGENYFPAVDSEIASEEDVPLQSLNLNTLLGNMEEARAGVSLVLLDACRDNPFARRFRSASRGLAKVEAASGTLIHYATRPGSVASDGEGKNGTYTEALLAQVGEPGVPVEQMLKRVTNRVVARTKGKQEPWVEGSLRGEFYFIFKGPATVNVQSAPADPEAETWAAAERANSAAGYQAYLDAYPKGRYAVAARIGLDALRKPAAPAPEKAAAAAVPPAPTPAPVAAVPDDPEAALWAEVKASGAREYFDAYLKQYPKGKYAPLARLELKKLDDRDKAQKAKEEAERKAELARLEAEKKAAAERERQEALRAEQQAWERAKSLDTEGAYAGYLENYAKGRYATLALAAQTRLQREAAERERQEAARKAREAREAEQRAWDEALRGDSEAGYSGFLAAYPASVHAGPAKNRLKQLEADAAYRAETEHWQSAQSARDSATVQTYLDRYPGGRYVSAAREKLAAVKKEESELRPGKVFRDCVDCPEMVIIPAGSFDMGGTEFGSERPIHLVSIGRAFAIGRTEVTQGQWRAVMGSNPSHFSSCGDDCPVEKVNWNDAQEYMRKLSEKTGKTYRLPSEAEWEYACRAGGNQTYCGGENVESFAWYGDNSGRRTYSVAGKQANAWGLYDMSGNIWEWTEDCWNDSHNGAPTDGGAWTRGNCGQRVQRGGSWNNDPQYVRAAFRVRNDSSDRGNDDGFRLARTLSP